MRCFLKRFNVLKGHDDKGISLFLGNDYRVMVFADSFHSFCQILPHRSICNCFHGNLL